MGKIEKDKETSAVASPILISEKLETEDEYSERVRNDLKENKDLIERNLGNNVISFAYPYGIFSEGSEEVLKETGHALTLTVKEGINTKQDGPYLLNRINVPPHTTGENIVKKIQEHQ